MGKKGKAIASILVLVVGAAIGWWLYDKYRVPPAIMESNVTFITPDGVKGLGDLNGHGTVIVFYARWCGTVHG